MYVEFKPFETITANDNPEGAPYDLYIRKSSAFLSESAAHRDAVEFDYTNSCPGADELFYCKGQSFYELFVAVEGSSDLSEAGTARTLAQIVNSHIQPLLNEQNRTKITIGIYIGDDRHRESVEDGRATVYQSLSDGAKYGLIRRIMRADKKIMEKQLQLPLIYKERPNKTKQAN